MMVRPVLLGLLVSTAAVMLFSSFQPADGAGMITHIEASNRAIQYFNRKFKGVDVRELLQTHQDAFVSGAVFPDITYMAACFQGAYVPTIGTATHSIFYIQAALNYWENEYLSKLTITDQKSQKMLAFILGNLAHITQDMAFLGFENDQTFRNTAVVVNRHGNLTVENHIMFNNAGDSIVLNEASFTNLHLAASQWYIPTADLVKIYGSILSCPPLQPPCPTAEDLQSVLTICPRMMMTRTLLNKALVNKWYVSFAMKAPMFLSPRFTDYFLGGLNDMAAWTMERLETAFRYLEDKTQCRCTSPSFNPIFWTCGDQPMLTPSLPTWLPYGTSTPANEPIILEGDEDKNEDLIDIVEDARTGSLFLRPKSSLGELVKELFKEGGVVRELLKKGLDAQQNSSSSATRWPFPDIYNETSTDHYEYYLNNKAYTSIGQSMVAADVNKDGAEDLIIGVPGYSEDNRFEEGRVYVVFAGGDLGIPSQNLDLDDVESRPNIQIIEAPFKGRGRFGYQVAVLDFNADSTLDLVVSAPIRASDVIEKPYSGFVYIYYGQRTTGQFSHKPDITIDCNMRYCNYGTTLSVGDVNRDSMPDLIIGSPYASRSFETKRQTGFVSVFYGGLGQKALYNSYRKADLLIWGLSPYSWFGYSAITTTMCDLLIGAPGQKTPSDFDHKCTPDMQMSGAVYCYNVETGGLETFARSHQEFEFFGGSLAEGFPNGISLSPVIAIGAPNTDITGTFKFQQLKVPVLLRQAGAVYLYNSYTKQEVSKLGGDRMYAAFGRDVKFVDVDGDVFDDLLVSAPMRSFDYTSVIYGAGVGEVLLFYGQNDFPHSALARPCDPANNVVPCLREQADGFFSSGDSSKAQLGASFVLLKSANMTQFVAASLHADDYARQSGKLYLFNHCVA